MKISFLHRITSLCLAILMFLTSVSFRADIHFCKGEFKSFSLVGKAPSCHTSKKSCPHHAKMAIEEDKKSDCCSNETFEVRSLDKDFTFVNAIELSNLQVQIVTSFIYTFIIHNPPPLAVYSTIPEIKVHLPSRDIYVLLERFLI